jgi:hypothetical protein
MQDIQSLSREVQLLRREVRGQRRSQRRSLLVAVVVVMLAAVSPIAAFAANPFNDLTGGVHDPNIDAIYNAGITTGCDPNVSYCPEGLVTRQEMASFLARTAGLGTNPPVANAKTAQTAGSATNATNATNAQNAQNAQNATNAQNAAQLGGQPANAYALKSEIPGGSGGPTEVWSSFFNLTAPDASVVLQNNPGQYNAQTITQSPRTIVTDPVVWGGHELLLPIDISPTLLGVTPRLSAYHVCYATSQIGGIGARIERTSIVIQGDSNPAEIGLDTTVRQSIDRQCFDVSIGQPATINGALFLRVRVNFFGQGGSDTVSLYSARLTFVP